MKPLVVHNHVPKTGGNFLRNCFAAAGVPVRHLLSTRESWFPEEALPGQFLSSHFLFRAGRPAVEEIPGEVLVVSLVRDPLSMFYSAFHFFRRPGNVRTVHVENLPDPFGGQVALIRSAASLEEYSSDSFLEAAEVDPFPVGAFPDPASLDFLGTSEKMGASLIALGDLLGERIPAVRSANVGRYDRAERPNASRLRRRFELEEEIWRSASSAL